MTAELLKYITGPMQNLYLIIMLVNALIHIMFAGAVARDAGQFTKQGQQTSLVSGIVWAFATLIGGVFVAAVYWFIHHSTLTRTK